MNTPMAVFISVAAQSRRITASIAALPKAGKVCSQVRSYLA